MRKTTNRFESALKKLYTAFHNNSLNPECCKQCAVGNILDNSEKWIYFSDAHGTLQLNYTGRINEAFNKRFNGYSPSELLQIEALFLKACGYQIPLHHKNKKPKNPTSKDNLFKGLSAVISYLCYLDNIDDFMDYVDRLIPQTTSSELSF